MKAYTFLVLLLQSSVARGNMIISEVVDATLSGGTLPWPFQRIFSNHGVLTMRTLVDNFQACQSLST
jgi:hypothetical protein